MTDWTGVQFRNHRRDASPELARVIAVAPDPARIAAGLDAREKRAIRLLAELDSRPAPEFDARPRVPACVSRRRLRMGDEAMQSLFWNGLVCGAGTPDARGTGNTPDSSWHWLSSLGLKVARELGAKIAGGCWESAAHDWRGVTRPMQEAS